MMLTAWLAGLSAVGTLLHRAVPEPLSGFLWSPRWTSSLALAWMFWDARWLELLVGTRKLLARSAALYGLSTAAALVLKTAPAPVALATALTVWKLRVVPFTWELRVGKNIQLYPFMFTLLVAALALYDANDLASILVGVVLGYLVR